jgi:hypothetical protein
MEQDIGLLQVKSQTQQMQWLRLPSNGRVGYWLLYMRRPCLSSRTNSRGETWLLSVRFSSDQITSSVPSWRRPHCRVQPDRRYEAGERHLAHLSGFISGRCVGVFPTKEFRCRTSVIGCRFPMLRIALKPQPFSRAKVASLQSAGGLAVLLVC